MLTNDVDLREANEKKQPNFTVATRKSCKKKLKLAVDMNYIFENRNNWFSKPSLFNTATSRLDARLVFKHTQKPDELISNAR